MACKYMGNGMLIDTDTAKQRHHPDNHCINVLCTKGKLAPDQISTTYTIFPAQEIPRYKQVITIKSGYTDLHIIYKRALW